jgi:chromosome segregation ATPase
MFANDRTTELDYPKELRAYRRKAAKLREELDIARAERDALREENKKMRGRIRALEKFRDWVDPDGARAAAWFEWGLAQITNPPA